MGVRGGGFGDAGDEVEALLHRLCSAGTVRLKAAKGGFGVLAGICESTTLG